MDEILIMDSIVTSEEASEESSLITPHVIKEISKDTVHRICSGQVIISLAIALKELIENSIDAGATNIDIRLVEYGSELIEVHDNGSGVEGKNFKALAMKHYTSKLKDYSQLEKIATLGFRGEALSSLCALCDLTIITRHSTAEYATKIEYDHSGNITKTTPSARSVGTTVVLSNLFSTLPVRKMEFSKNIKREYSKMSQLLTAYCIVSTGIKFTCNNKCGIGANKLVLSTPGSGTIKQNIVCIFDAKLLSTLVEVHAIPPTKDIAEEYGIEINENEPLVFNFDCLISSAIHGSGKSSSNRQFIYINDRPCDFPKMVKLVNEVYRSYNNSQYPFIYLNIKTISTIVDVNVTPDKRQVFLEKEKLLLATLKTSLHNTLKDFPSTFKMQNLDISRNQEKEKRSAKISNEQQSRGIKRFLTDYDKKSEKISDMKRSKSDSFNIEGKRISNDTINIQEKQNQFKKYQHVCTSTQMLDSFIEQAEKVISDNTENSIIEEETTKKNNDSALLKIYETRSCTLKKISQKIINNETPKTKSATSDDSDNFIKNPVVSDATNLKIIENKTPIQRNSKSVKDKDGVNSISITPEERKSKSIANILEESGIEVVELTQSKDYEEISKYRNRIPLKISLQSIQDKLDEIDDASHNHSIQVNFRSNISPSSNSEAENELQRNITKTDFSKMEIIGQFNLAFMVVKLKHDLFIIDQHACDEKYNFEQLQLSTVIESQNMVRPLSLELTAANEELIMEYEQIFNRNGFFFIINKDDDPTKRIKLTRIPRSKNYTFGKEDIDEMLCLLQEDDSTANVLRPSRVRMMFASRACRKSVMIGKTLNNIEMRKLVNHMGEIEEPWNCPHGRPTMRHLINLHMLKK